VRVYEFVERERATENVATMCRVLGVSTSGYYEWRTRPKSRRTLEDEALTEVIKGCHDASRKTYGYRRIRADLVEDHGMAIGKGRVARLMREAGICGVTRRKFRRTTVRDDWAKPAPDLVARRFHAEEPDKVWCADITYVRTWTGWLFLAVVIDVFSRRVVGWSVAPHLRPQLVTTALWMAIGRRQPNDVVVHHSDQGGQYTSRDFEKACRAAGVERSMGASGDCFDNALAESFFATLECELLDRVPFRTQSEARFELHHYIEHFYNQRRRHSSLGNLSPVNFERRWRETNGLGDAA
jgi:putative transposase